MHPLSPVTYFDLREAVGNWRQSDQIRWSRRCLVAAGRIERHEFDATESNARKMLRALLELRQMLSDHPDALTASVVRVVNLDILLSVALVAYGR